MLINSKFIGNFYNKFINHKIQLRAIFENPATRALRGSSLEPPSLVICNETWLKVNHPVF